MLQTSDLILKEMHGICKTKSHTKEQIKEYKMTEWEIFETYDNLSENQFNTKSNKTIYVRNDVMTTVIKRCGGEKKKKKKKKDKRSWWF